jgi:hypothetical protein
VRLMHFYIELVDSPLHRRYPQSLQQNLWQE